MRNAEHVVPFLATLVLFVGCATQEKSPNQYEGEENQARLNRLAEEGEAQQRLLEEEETQQRRLKEDATPQISVGSVDTPPSEGNIPVTYQVLRGPWKPYDAPQSLGLEILIPESATQDGIVRLLKELTIGKDPVSITVWTRREVWENARRNIYDDLYDQHLICVYTKNMAVQGRAYFGFDGIKWVQEKGRFSHLANKTTPINTDPNLAQAQASKPSPAPAQASDLQTFMNIMKSAGIDSSVLVRASQKEDSLTIVVANGWHYQPYQVRLQMAQNLWTIWANIRSPNDVDKVHLEVTDLNDNSVGGSRWLAGSLIWVKKD